MFEIRLNDQPYQKFIIKLKLRVSEDGRVIHCINGEYNSNIKSL